MSFAVVIREYEPLRDYPALRALMSALQEIERPMDPALPPGEAIADDYLAWIFANCSAHDGKVFLAEARGRVVGFVTILVSVMPDEPDEPRRPFAWLGELIVAAAERGRGIGRTLLARAEAHAKAHGARLLRTKALAANRNALAFYALNGFTDREVEMEKRLV